MPGHGINNKWRFYVDNASNKLTFVPMAHYDPTDHSFLNDENFLTNINDKEFFKILNSHSSHRLKSYINSLVWGKKSWAFIKNVTALSDIALDLDELNLLFGTQIATEILLLYGNLSEDYGDLFTLKDKGQSLYFYHAYTELNNKDKNTKIEIEEDDLFFNYFIKFFINLAKLISENNESEYAFKDTNYLPTASQIIEDPYLRLLVGPTFNELLRLSKDYFTVKCIDISNKFLHLLVSKTLDRQIDQGFIVPVFDCYGRRIFRKGEPSPYSIYELKLLNCWGSILLLEI